MKTTIEDKNGVLTVAFDGHLDTIHVPEVEENIRPIFTTETKEIILDCSKLEYISSSGFRIFLSIALNSQETGKHVTITGVNSFVGKLFEITGFTDLFDFK
jgi:anti-sigma B factor antagonist